MESTPLILILSLFTASFLGSWHCAVMCGPVACFVSNQGNVKLYHLGRLLTYVSLGALAGAFGEVLFSKLPRGFYITVICSVTALILISSLLRLNLISIKNTPLNSLKQQTNLILFRLFKKWGGKSSFIMGVLTGFLPCGWLMMFVLSVVATHSAISGAFILFIFWLGGLPALISVTGVIAKLVDHSPAIHQKIAAVVLVFAAIFSSVSFIFNINFL